MFPEEILHAIVAALVSRPVISEDLLQFHWRYVRGKLLSLALASKQLRRICMPFLFAYIEVKGAHGDLEKLGEQCAANPSFAACIRTFDLYCYAPEQVDAIHYFLHRCQNISQIILNKVQLDESLLHILRRHSAARIALASYSLPTCKEVGWLTMKRLNIGIDHTSIRDEKSELELAKHLECGIQLRSLTIHPNLLHKSFSTCVFGGLCELELWLSSIPFSLSWLAEFTAAHPLLRKIRISTPSVWDTAIMARDIPLIFSFLGEARREGLADEMKLQLKGFSVTRRTSPEATAALASSSSLTHSAESLAGWQVTGLWLSFTEKFSSRLLQLVHSSFPQIRIMSIENPLPSHGVKFIEMEELTNSLCCFTSLETLNLLYVFGNINYPDENCSDTHRSSVSSSRYSGHPQIRGPREKSICKLERAVEIASCFAKRIPTVEKILLQDICFKGYMHIEGDGSSGSLRPFTDSEVNNLLSLYI